MIYIITDYDDHYRSEREKDLVQWAIAYNELVIRGGKERFCQQHGIEFAIDDDAVEYYPRARIVTLELAILIGAGPAPS